MLMNTCLRITFYFITLVVIVNGSSGETFHTEDGDNYVQSDIEYLEDFPQVIDLILYLQSLKKILDFAHRYKNGIDMNFAFGLSIVYDNIQHVLLRKEDELQKDIKMYIKSFLRYNGELLQYFESMVKHDKEQSSLIHRRVSSLFLNRTLGTRGISDFKNRKMSPVFLTRSSYPKWDSYESKVYQFNRWKPDPGEADICVASLAKNRLNKRVCRFMPMCYNILVNGTNFGYSLTHRLVWLLQAYRGRGCRIFSVREDKELIDVICTKIFREANYIAKNKFKVLDLLLEQMTLCSMAGYPDTLRRSWMTKMLKHQTQFGCFSTKWPLITTIPKKYKKINNEKWSISASTTEMLGGACDRHLTAVAAAALSGAIRYILEEKYSKE